MEDDHEQHDNWLDLPAETSEIREVIEEIVVEKRSRPQVRSIRENGESHRRSHEDHKLNIARPFIGLDGDGGDVKLGDCFVIHGDNSWASL